LCLNRLEILGLLSQIHPGLIWHSERSAALDGLLNQPHPEGWNMAERYWNVATRKILGYGFLLYRLPREEIHVIATRLRLPAQIIRVADQAAELFNKKTDVFIQKISSLVEHLAEATTPSLAVLYSEAEPFIQEKINSYQRDWRHIQPGIDGHTLVSLGIPPGPGYRFILHEMRKAWLDGEVTNMDQEKAFLQHLLSIAGEIQSDI